MSTGQFNLDGKAIEVADSFNFLGAKISTFVSTSKGLRRRIAISKENMNGLSSIMQEKSIAVKTKYRLVKALVFQSSCCKKLVLTKVDQKRVDAFEIWWWQRLLRIALIERRTNYQFLLK